jgi:hypothetical protein
MVIKMARKRNKTNKIPNTMIATLLARKSKQIKNAKQIKKKNHIAITNKRQANLQ